MRLINIYCNDSDSFKYSILLYLYYYNIKNNHGRISQLNNNLNPYIPSEFNKNSDIAKFEKDNTHISLFIIDINGEPLFLTRNNASIKVMIVKLNDNRYTIIKPSIHRFNDNIREINKRNRDKCKKYKLTDEIKNELALDPSEYQKLWLKQYLTHYYAFRHQKMCNILFLTQYKWMK